VGFKPFLVGFKPFLVGFKPVLVGFKPVLVGFKPVLVGFMPTTFYWPLGCTTPSLTHPAYYNNITGEYNRNFTPREVTIRRPHPQSGTGEGGDKFNINNNATSSNLLHSYQSSAVTCTRSRRCSSRCSSNDVISLWLDDLVRWRPVRVGAGLDHCVLIARTGYLKQCTKTIKFLTFPSFCEVFLFQKMLLC